MSLPKGHIQIVAYLLERGDQGATAPEIRERFSLTASETTAWLGYLRNRNLIEAIGSRGTYRYRVTRRCWDLVASALGDVQRADGGWWKWLGLAVLLVILLSDDR